jgi:hypothetical protein
MAALLAYLATDGLVPLITNDTYLHLTTGRLILEQGSVPQSDSYSFTALGNRYVAHEWLAAVLYAFAEKLGGPPAVVVAGKLIPALLLGVALLAALAAAGASWGLGLPIAVLAVTVARSRILARPELLALVLVLTALALLLRDRRHAREGRRTRALYALVPLGSLWVNVHASFPIGIGLVLMFAAADAAEGWLARRDRLATAGRALCAVAALGAAAALLSVEPSLFALPAAGLVAVGALLLAVDAAEPIFAAPPRRGSQGPLRLLAVAALMAAALSLNPRGPGILLFPFEFTAGVNTVTASIAEWRPLLALGPSLHPSLRLPAYLAFLATGFGALALGVRRRRLGLLEVLLFLGFALLPLRHNRWMALSALAATPALTALLGAASGAPQRPGRTRSALALLLTALSLALLSGAAAAVVDTPPDPFLLGPLALVVACGASALAWALRPGLPERAGTIAAGACALVLAAAGALHGIPDRSGLVYRPDFTLQSRDPAPPLSHGFPALRFLESEGLEGRLFTEYQWAGPAIHRLWPAVHVFIDSRSEVYGNALLRKYYRMLTNPIAARRGLDGYDVELVLVAHRTYPFDMRYNGGILVLLENDSNWALLYADDHAVLYARTDRGRALPSSLEPLRPRHLRPDTLGAPDPELEALLGRALERAPHSSSLRFALASLLAARGETSQAWAQLERAWEANPRQPAAPQLAGELATADGDVEAARVWFQRAEQAGMPSKLRHPR